MTMGAGAVTLISRNQGMNTCSSTEAKVVAADEVVGSMIWTNLFLEAQGYPVKENILFQDNWSATLLKEKGWQSARKRSRHLNIWLFFVKDQKEKGNVSIQYCPIDQMIGDSTWQLSDSAITLYCTRSLTKGTCPKRSQATA
jgi:hypothetical protein